MHCIFTSFYSTSRVIVYLVSFSFFNLIGNVTNFQGIAPIRAKIISCGKNVRLNKKKLNKYLKKIIESTFYWMLLKLKISSQYFSWRMDSKSLSGDILVEKNKLLAKTLEIY